MEIHDFFDPDTFTRSDVVHDRGSRDAVGCLPVEH